MARSPSTEWDEGGVLTRRAIATDVVGEPDEAEATATQPYRTPVPTKAPVLTKGVQATYAKRTGSKAVERDEVENKSVGAGATKRTRREYDFG